MRDEQDDYVDRPVPSYMITGGRAHPTRNTLRPETLLATADGTTVPRDATPEQRALLTMCHRLLSLVEAATHLSLPVSVVRVVASTLVDDGLLTIRSTSRPADVPDRALLKKVLDGLRKL